MKKIIAFAVLGIMALGILCGSVFAAEGENPVGGVKQITVLPPIELTDEEAEDIVNTSRFRASVYSEAPDWLENKFLPGYEYFLSSPDYGQNYAEAYNLIYNALYRFGGSYSAQTYMSGSNYYIAVDVSALFGQSDFADQTTYSKITDIAYAVLSDNPQFYFTASSFSTSYGSQYRFIMMGIEKDYVSGTNRKKENDIITEAVAGYDTLVEGLDSNYKVELAVHDKIIAENEYEYDENGKPSNEHYAHSVIGILDPSYNGAVCQGYSDTMQMLLNRYGVACYYLSGEVTSGSSTGSHAWNAVQLDDGEFHCVDSTWDDYTAGGHPTIYYRYFNRPASTFYSANSRDNSGVYITDIIPELSENNNFYNSAYENYSLFQFVFNGYATQNNETGYTFLPPEVTYPSARVAADASDIDPLVYPVSDYTAAYTAREHGGSVESGIEYDIVCDGNWTKGYNGYTSSTNSEFAVVTYDSCKLRIGLQFPEGSFNVVLDDKYEIASYTSYGTTYYYVYTFAMPHGKHKLAFVHSGSGNIGAKFSSAIAAGDVNEDAVIDVKDAISLLTALDSTFSDKSKYLLYDANGDNVIDEADAAAILRKQLGLSY